MRKPPATGPVPTSELLTVLRRAVPSLVRSAPLIVSLMALTVVLQGLLPAATVFLSKWTVDGITAAEQIVAEIGTDMRHVRSAGHLCSWAKVCPGNHESAGKRRSGKTGQGNRWSRTP